jgi:peptidoglycan/LPS O-acetylase OafA/YrhL
MATITAQTFTPSVAQNLVRCFARVPELDGLRGVAILSVMAFHYLGPLTSETRGILRYIHPFVAMGWAGVDLFFVLSGFLIGGILLDARTSPQYFKTFYIRRFYRIIPLYYAWICAYVLLVAVLGRTQLPSTGLQPEASPPLYTYFVFLQNLRVFHFSGIAAAWLGVTWSLAVEEQFYLIIPLLIWLLPRRALSAALGAVILCAPLLRLAVHISAQSGPALVNLLMPCRADAFAMGIMAAILWRDSEVRAYLAANGIVMPILLGASFAGFLAISATWYSQPWSLGMQTIGLTAIAFFFAVTIFFALSSPTNAVASMMRTGWVCDIGVVSYCMYLIHLAIWGTFHILLLADIRSESQRWLGVGVSLVAGFCTYVIAKTSWVWFEKPFVSLGHSYRY